MPRGISPMEAVVDHRGDELALPRRHGLLLDHRGDLEDVEGVRFFEREYAS